MSSSSVLIAGAGPSGLILAIILLQSGVSVRIIDKELQHRIGSRGPGIQPRTLELYDILGIQGMPLQQEYRPVMARYRPGEIEPVATTDMVDWVEPTPDTPHPNPIYIPQEEHEEILRQNLQNLSCTVELGSELRSFEQFPDRVVAHILKHRADGTSEEETATFDWLVGTDGAHSVVRKQLGLSFLGESLTESVALGDIVVEEGVEPGRFHIWSVPPKLIALRSGLKTSNVFMFAYTGRPEARASTPITREEFIQDFYALTGRRDVKFGAVTWTSIYRPSMRMVETMREGRVFIAGDAAHTHTPAGGQGLNSSVQDAANLGWKLALACQSKSLHPPSSTSTSKLLDSYSAERLRVIAQMLSLTTDLFTKTFAHLGTPGVGSSKDAEAHDSAWKRGTDLRMLGVNYVGSPIVLADQDADDAVKAKPAGAYKRTEGARAGAAYRAPDAPGLVRAGAGDGAELRLFADVFSAAAHTVLVFGAPRRAVVDAVGGLGLPAGCVRTVVILPSASVNLAGEAGAGAEMVLEDRAGCAYAGYGVRSGELTVVVVRPDGVVGAIVRDAEGVEKYFRLIFGA